jgi:DNA mismatch repair ATPase MutL
MSFSVKRFIFPFIYNDLKKTLTKPKLTGESRQKYQENHFKNIEVINEDKNIQENHAKNSKKTTSKIAGVLSTKNNKKTTPKLTGEPRQK